MQENRHDPSRRNLIAMLAGLPLSRRIQADRLLLKPSTIPCLCSQRRSSSISTVPTSKCSLAFILWVRVVVMQYILSRWKNGKRAPYLINDMDATRKEAKVFLHNWSMQMWMRSPVPGNDGWRKHHSEWAVYPRHQKQEVRIYHLAVPYFFTMNWQKKVWT